MLGPRKPLTVDAGTPVGEVLRLMVDRRDRLRDGRRERATWSASSASATR